MLPDDSQFARKPYLFMNSLFSSLSPPPPLLRSVWGIPCSSFQASRPPQMPRLLWGAFLNSLAICSFSPSNCLPSFFVAGMFQQLSPLSIPGVRRAAFCPVQQSWRRTLCWINKGKNWWNPSQLHVFLFHPKEGWVLNSVWFVITCWYFSVFDEDNLNHNPSF